MRALRWNLFALLAAALAGCPSTVSRDYVSADPGGSVNLADGVPATSGDGSAGGDTSAVRQVVEPDVIRQDGNLLYVLNQYRGLSIVDLSHNQLLSQAPVYGFPRDLYVADQRAYVISAYASNTAVDGETVSFSVTSRLYVLDISAPASPRILTTFDLKGDLVDSRVVGDVLYAVGAEYQWTVTPVTTGSGGGVTSGGGSSGGNTGIAVPPAQPTLTKQQTSDTRITSINIADPNHIAQTDEVSFPGAGNVIQATAAAIFVAAQNWETGNTTITYVDIHDPNGAIVVRGSATLPGIVADKFKIDEWNGTLRVVSAANWPNRNVYVSAIDLAQPDHLAILASNTIDGAAGETAFATRFDGPRGYVVSYLQVDPLFVLDLSDPKNPHVAGELVVPGWSTYIEPQGDRLVALGVDDTNGRRVSVSLFNVADPANPTLTARQTFGDNWNWSNAFTDVQSLTILDDTIIVPFSGWTDAGGFERLQFLSYSHDTLTLRGYVDLQGDILRSFAYDGKYYGVTTEELATIDGTNLDAPAVSERLTLAEYVADVQALPGNNLAQIVTHFDDGTSTVEVTDAANAVVGALDVKLSNVGSAQVSGALLTLTGIGSDATHSFYDVARIDCSNPAHPALAWQTRVDVNPYWGWFMYGGPIPLDAPAGAQPPGVVTGTSASSGPVASGTGGNSSGGAVAPGAGGSGVSSAFWNPWYFPTDNSFVVNGVLALRCTSDKYDLVVGDKTPSQGIALVDLATGTWTSTVGLGYDQVAGMNAGNLNLYLTTKDSLGADAQGRPVCAFYISALDPAAPAAGPRANVPGMFLQYDEGSGLLLLNDSQYGDGYSTHRSINSVSWTRTDKVQPIAQIALPDNTSNVLARGARIYFDYYDTTYHLGDLNIGSDGSLTGGKSVQVDGAWAYLMDAKGDNAYLVTGSSVARYVFGAGSPALAEITPLMNTPTRIRFVNNGAYAVLGYSGVVQLPQ